MDLISSTNHGKHVCKPSCSIFVSQLLVMGSLMAATSAQAATMDLNITNIAGFPAAGIAYYDSNGLVGDIFGQTLTSLGLPNFTGPALAMPGPGPITGKLPRIAALVQFSVDPNKITPGDLAPSLHPNQSYFYNFSGFFTIAGRDGVFPLNFNYPISFSFTATANSLLGNPGWILVDSNNQQDTWVHYGLASLTEDGGEGFITFATTDIAPVDDLLGSGPANGGINGGKLIVTTIAVPEAGSVLIAGLGGFVLILGHGIRQRRAS
jgi:hypothetical protein